MSSFLGILSAYRLVELEEAESDRQHPQKPVLTHVGDVKMVWGTEAERALDGALQPPNPHGFEGGRIMEANGAYYLFTAEFRGPPINANMRIALWKADSFDSAVNGPWSRLRVLRETSNNASKPLSADDILWTTTCDKNDFEASPWAPFPQYDYGEDRWHVHYVSYACDMSWVVRVGISNVLGLRSQVTGIAGIEGPYETYAKAYGWSNSVVIGPNATGDTATRWGDTGDCAPCLDASIAPKDKPLFCHTPPCLYDNGYTGAAICSGPFHRPLWTGDPNPYVSFVGLDHALAWAPAMRGPWTIGTADQVGQNPMEKIRTPSVLYTENPVVSNLSTGFFTVYDTVSPYGGYVQHGGTWKLANHDYQEWDHEANEWAWRGRGEPYGFGFSFSVDGMYWSNGVDVQVLGGCRTPLGVLQDPADANRVAVIFTRRFETCPASAHMQGHGVVGEEHALPAFYERIKMRFRGDACNEVTMCAPLYSAFFSVGWEDWKEGQ